MYPRSMSSAILWRGIGVKIKVSFYYDVLLCYFIVYAFTDAAFALSVAHFSFKDHELFFFLYLT